MFTNVAIERGPHIVCFCCYVLVVYQVDQSGWSVVTKLHALGTWEHLGPGALLVIRLVILYIMSGNIYIILYIIYIIYYKLYIL